MRCSPGFCTSDDLVLILLASASGFRDPAAIISLATKFQTPSTSRLCHVRKLCELCACTVGWTEAHTNRQADRQTNIEPAGRAQVITRDNCNGRPLVELPLKTGEYCQILIAVQTKMVNKKRAVDPIVASSDPVSAKKAKQQVTTSMFEKWQRQFESEFQTLAWLYVEPQDKCMRIPSSLLCI